MAIMKKSLDFLVQTHNFDVYDNIKPTGVFTLFQDIAAIHAEDLGIGYEDLVKNNLAWVILYETYEVVKMPKFLENVVVSTWPKPKGRIEFEREYLIASKNGECLIKGISNWVVIDLNSRSFVRSDKIDYNGEYFDYTNYLEKTKRKISLDKNSVTDWFEFKVQYDDLDHNGHMNNTRYLNYLINNYYNYNQNKFCKKCEIAFVKEVKLNDIVNVGSYQIDDDKIAYIGYHNDNLCFECILNMEDVK